ncbi:MAG TPA: type I methionyl aminopeptidase [Candidatus Binatia bacterium]|nr:type I methionyl aminopeptidase [Candidatus Binatia bacterium]
MSVESAEDLNELRRIGRVAARVLEALKAEVRVGVTTAHLDRRCAELLALHGARSAPRLFYDFPGSICISVNDEAVHGVPGPRAVRAGDLVKLDLVAERHGYLADVAITVAVPPAAPRAHALATCARRAFHRALEVIRAGRRVRDVGQAIETEVRRRGFAVIRELGGHGVGRAIHEAPEVPNYADRGNDQILTNGLVIAVEPIIAAGSGAVYEADDGWTIKTVDGGEAAHYEHTLVVTHDRPIVLTAL